MFPSHPLSSAGGYKHLYKPDGSIHRESDERLCKASAERSFVTAGSNPSETQYFLNGALCLPQVLI